MQHPVFAGDVAASSAITGVRSKALLARIHSPHLKEIHMFILKSAADQTALMKSGDPFLYSSRELARMGAKALESTKGRMTVAPFTR
jgi:precorrin-4 methylase